MLGMYWFWVEYNMNFSACQNQVVLNYSIRYCLELFRNIMDRKNSVEIMTLHLYICVLSNMKFQALWLTGTCMRFFYYLSSSLPFRLHLIINVGLQKWKWIFRIPLKNMTKEGESKFLDLCWFTSLCRVTTGALLLRWCFHTQRDLRLQCGLLILWASTEHLQLTIVGPQWVFIGAKRMIMMCTPKTTS